MVRDYSGLSVDEIQEKIEQIKPKFEELGAKFSGSCTATERDRFRDLRSELRLLNTELRRKMGYITRPELSDEEIAYHILYYEREKIIHRYDEGSTDIDAARYQSAGDRLVELKRAAQERGIKDNELHSLADSVEKEAESLKQLYKYARRAAEALDHGQGLSDDEENAMKKSARFSQLVDSLRDKKI